MSQKTKKYELLLLGKDYLIETFINYFEYHIIMNKETFERMTRRQQDIFNNFKKRLRSDNIKTKTLESYLKQGGSEALIGRKFVGYDCDYARLMIYKVEEFNDHGPCCPTLIGISELTVFPRARVYEFLSLPLHTKDIDVTSLPLYLEEIEKLLDLPTNNFQ